MGKEILGSLELNRAYQMDCLEGMKLLPDKSINMILCDLPYGTTACNWDTVIPFKPLWEQYERIIKDNGAIVLTASQPFTSALIMSNIKNFRYCWVWDKARGTNFQHAKKMPMKSHEDICVFYKKLPTYNPQMREGKPYKTSSGFRKTKTQAIMDLTDGQKKDIEEIGRTFNAGVYREATINKGERYPLSILTYKKDKDKYHPTQKPVGLFEYLIKTYTNEGEIVLDNCLGSGTTSVACELNSRKWIGFETESKYIEVINKRLDSIQLEDSLNRISRG